MAAEINDPALRAIAEFLATSAKVGAVDQVSLRGLSAAAQAGGLAWDHVAGAYYPVAQPQPTAEASSSVPALPPLGEDRHAAETVLRHWLRRYARECGLPEPGPVVFDWRDTYRVHQSGYDKAYTVHGTASFGRDHTHGFTASYTLHGNTEQVAFTGLPGKASVQGSAEGVCKGDLLLGTACGHCSKCKAQLEDVKGVIQQQTAQAELVKALSEECAGLLADILRHNRLLSPDSSKRFASPYFGKVQTLVHELHGTLP